MNISAVILAAGKSARMGQNKMLMKWGDIIVLEKVIRTIQDSGVEDIIIVTTNQIAEKIKSSRLRFIINESKFEAGRPNI